MDARLVAKQVAISVSRFLLVVSEYLPKKRSTPSRQKDASKKRGGAQI